MKLINKTYKIGFLLVGIYWKQYAPYQVCWIKDNQYSILVVLKRIGLHLGITRR